VTFAQLRNFLEVARQGSVRAASAALMITEPSVSAALASLREELQVSLVEREGRGIRLTPAGAELALYAAQILSLSDLAVRRVREAAGRPAPLHLVAVNTAGEYLLPSILKTFRHVHPEVQLLMEVGNRAMVLERVSARNADLGFGGRPPEGGGVVGEPFLDNELIVVGPQGHPLASRGQIAPGLLAKETWLVREVGSGTRLSTQEFFTIGGIEPASILTLGSNGAVKQATAAGLGITLLSTHAVAPELKDGTLARLPVEGTPLPRPWYVLYVEGGVMTESSCRFLRLLRAGGSTAAGEARDLPPLAHRAAS
jgi:DNA-binding transcriptional LysR family regulator